MATVVTSDDAGETAIHFPRIKLDLSATSFKDLEVFRMKGFFDEAPVLAGMKVNPAVGP
jgi:hypothetical protein